MIFSLLFSALALAGGTVGNGGNVVLCPGAAPLTLDRYEASSLRSMTVALGAPTLTVEEKIDLAVTRLARVDLQRAGVIKKLAASFNRDARFVKGVVLAPVGDAYEPYLPSGCRLAQIAVQNKQVLEIDPFYLVDQDLWDRLDNDSKAILVLHEVIFRGSRDEWTSGLVRTYSAFAFSDWLDTHTAQNFWINVFRTPVYADMLHVFKAPDGRWFFQAPDARLWNFMPTRSDHRSNVNANVCAKFDGDQLQMADSHVVYDWLWKNGAMAGDRANYWAFDSLGAHLVESNSGVIDGPHDLSATYWCTTTKLQDETTWYWLDAALAGKVNP